MDTKLEATLQREIDKRIWAECNLGSNKASRSNDQLRILTHKRTLAHIILGGRLNPKEPDKDAHYLKTCTA